VRYLTTIMITALLAAGCGEEESANAAEEPSPIDCYVLTFDECEEEPECVIRVGTIKGENQCLVQANGYCWEGSNCNNVGIYTRAPNGTCYQFGRSCPPPPDWGERTFGEGPCGEELGGLDLCE